VRVQKRKKESVEKSNTPTFWGEQDHLKKRGAIIFPREERKTGSFGRDPREALYYDLWGGGTGRRGFLSSLKGREKMLCISSWERCCREKKLFLAAQSRRS